MTLRIVHVVPVGVVCCLAAAGPAGEAVAQPDVERQAPGQTVRRYTKEWRDDYHNYSRVVYHAYTNVLKDETGFEVAAEIWHGRAIGYHKNARKAWEVVYRDGRREGEFTMWAENGARTVVA